MKTFYFLALIIACIAASAKTQDDPIFVVSGNLNLKIGYNKSASFQKFVDSYNLLNNTNKTKLTNFGATTGYSVGIDLFAKGIFFGYYQHKIWATSNSWLNDYATREFRLRQGTYGMDVGWCNLSKSGGIAIFTGVYITNANIIADIKYRDGFRSIGSDAALNGIYNGFSISTSLGIKAYKYKGPLGVHASLRWCPVLSGGEFDDQPMDQRIPEDWGNYRAVGGWLNYKGKYVNSGSQSIYLDLGIAVRIFTQN